MFTDIEGSTRLLQELGEALAGASSSTTAVLREALRRRAAGFEVADGGRLVLRRLRARRRGGRGGRRRRSARWPPSRGRTGPRARADGPAHRRGGSAAATATTSASTSTARRASRRPATAARCCSPSRRRSWSRDELPAGVTLRDLGEHRLKDLAAPSGSSSSSIAGLPADFPPLADARRRAQQPADAADQLRRPRAGDGRGARRCCSRTRGC